MPNNGKRFNKHHNRYRHQNEDGIQKSYHNGGVNGHHNNNTNRNNKHYGNSNNNRKYIFNPSIISSLDDDDFSNDQNSNGFNNGSKHNNNNSHKNDHHKRSNKDRRKMVDRLKEMGLAKAPKLSIGDTDNDVKKNLLESKPHCQISNLPKDVFDLIVNYVQNYFTCFDTKREDLLAAYNPKCTFSLTLNMSNNQNAYRSFKYDDYLIRENRNLKRLVGNENHHRDKRFQLQHRGYIDTLSVLCKMPPTEHDPRSFKLDISFFSPNMITFSLGGVFKEGKQTDKVRPLRSFHRVFVCIPDPNSQMTIVNEQFIISNITQDQFKLYYDTSKQPQIETSAIDQQQQQATTSTISTTSMPGLNEQQTELIKEFSNKSRLNLEWSKYCLEHAKWNFEEAAQVFVQFKESIPLDAFLN